MCVVRLRVVCFLRRGFSYFTWIEKEAFFFWLVITFRFFFSINYEEIIVSFLADGVFLSFRSRRLEGVIVYEVRLGSVFFYFEMTFLRFVVVRV